MAHDHIVENQSIDELYKAIISLQSVEECYDFFEDLCTVNEILSMAQRYHVALMLRNGVTYHDIADETGASSATISRVNKSYNYGAGGYKKIIERVAAKEGDE